MRQLSTSPVVIQSGEVGASTQLTNDAAIKAFAQESFFWVRTTRETESTRSRKRRIMHDVLNIGHKEEYEKSTPTTAPRRVQVSSYPITPQ